MPAVPVPFVVSLFMALLLARLVMEGDRNLRPAVWFLVACIITSVITGLRWTFDLSFLKVLQLIAGTLFPFFAWMCFSTLKHRHSSRLWPYFLGGIVVLVVAVVAGGLPGDLILAALYLGVGVALIRMAQEGPDGFGAARLSDAPKVRNSVLLACVMLITSGLFDVLIGMDFQFYGGLHAIGIITVGDILFLPLIAYAVVAAGSSASTDEDDYAAAAGDEPASPPMSKAEDSTIFAAFDALMRDKKLYCDPDLTLNRLARRLGVPSRQISGAINRLKGQNVSQAVNDYRIAQAKRLLAETERSVTEVMLESGFRTKSNFNREFLRVTGMSPSAWRLKMPSSTVPETATAT